MIKEPFVIIEDELEDDETPVKKVAKKASKKAAKKDSKSSRVSRPVSVRIPLVTLSAIAEQGIDVSEAFKAFCEELVHSKICPACGQNFKKKV